ncbi:hypothetical protein L1887_43229 [Cichorium endivia]|nr:hypothetical protein L1887_43229 [Cichorium endivia]
MLQSLCFAVIVSAVLSSTASPPEVEFTVFGGASVNHTSMILTNQSKKCFSEIGAVYNNVPIQLFDVHVNSTVSFYNRLKFTITPPPPPCRCREGISFMIIPIETIFNSVESTSFAVHVDTNHRISIVVDSTRVALVDATRSGVDLKNGKPVTVYMEYDKYQIKIWVGQIKSGMPLLAAPVDLSNRFRGFGYVVVSAAGCSIKSINRWEFGRLTDDEQGSCIVCFRDRSDELRIGSTVQDIPIQRTPVLAFSSMATQSKQSGYDFTVNRNLNAKLSTYSYRGKVLLIVNVASQ